MILCLDVGNTNTVIGVFEQEILLHRWRLRTEKEMTEDEMGLLVNSLFAGQGISLVGVSGTVVACVVPYMVRSLKLFFRKHLNHKPYWVEPGRFAEMPILYGDPNEVGADRIVNAVGAYSKYKTSLVVVDFGTATTFDCISDEGAYLGGAISPGMIISSEALFEKAARLPRGRLFEVPTGVIGKTTIDSMNAGIVYGYAGLVDGIVGRIREEMASHPKVIATGGLAELVAKFTHTIEAVERDLTLEGLRVIHAMRRQEE